MTYRRLEHLDNDNRSADGLSCSQGNELISYIRNELVRQLRLEEVAKKYSASSMWMIHTETWHVAAGHDTPLGLISMFQMYPTRRACDDAIIVAVDAYEKEGGK